MSRRDDDASGDLFASPPDLARDYVTVGGVRLVRPYAFDFVCHVKQRQAGLDVVEAFAREFPGRPRSYYEAAHGIGLLRVEERAPARNKPPGKKKGSDKARKRPYPGNEEAHEEAIFSTSSSTPPAKESFPKNPGGSKTRERAPSSVASRVNLLRLEKRAKKRRRHDGRENAVSRRRSTRPRRTLMINDNS